MSSFIDLSGEDNKIVDANGNCSCIRGMKFVEERSLLLPKVVIYLIDNPGFRRLLLGKKV